MKQKEPRVTSSWDIMWGILAAALVIWLVVSWAASYNSIVP